MQRPQEFIPLSKSNPELLTQWNYEKTKLFSPDDVTNTSHRRVWWLCDHGHEIFEPIKVRVMTGGCSECGKAMRREIAAMRNRQKEAPFTNTFDDLIYNPTTKLRDLLFVGGDYSNVTVEEFLECALDSGKKEVRLYNSLKRMGANTLNELLNASYEDIARIRNLGEATQRKLYDLLKSYFKTVS